MCVLQTWIFQLPRRNGSLNVWWRILTYRQTEDISCDSCNLNVDETQSHILICTYLIKHSQILTYLPSYSELFGPDIEVQVYISRLLRDNYKRRIVWFIDYSSLFTFPIAHVNWELPLFYCYCKI